MLEVKTCIDSLEKINNFFYNSFKIVLDYTMKEEDVSDFNERYALFELLVKGNIVLKNNNVELTDETRYDIDRRILYISNDATIKDVEFVIVNTVVKRMLDTMQIAGFKTKCIALYALLYGIGLVKYSPDRLFIGSEHIMVSNLTRVILLSI